jgi:peroxiredoxin Q/BCP
LRDNFEKLTEKGVKVYGVSLQDADSHKAFIDKFDFQFPLVVDDGTLCKAFNVPYKGEFASRQSFLIGEDGKLIKVWREVTPAGHAEEVLAAIE